MSAQPQNPQESVDQLGQAIFKGFRRFIDANKDQYQQVWGDRSIPYSEEQLSKEITESFDIMKKNVIMGGKNRDAKIENLNKEIEALKNEIEGLKMQVQAIMSLPSKR